MFGRTVIRKKQVYLGDGYTRSPDFTTTQYIHVSKLYLYPLNLFLKKEKYKYNEKLFFFHCPSTAPITYLAMGGKILHISILEMKASFKFQRSHWGLCIWIVYASEEKI